MRKGRNGVMRERIWSGTGKTKNHFSCHRKKPSIVEASIYIYEGDLNESPNNMRDKASISRNGLHLIELLAKDAPWKLPNIPNYCQDYCLLSVNQ